MKKNILFIALMIALVQPPKMEVQASNCSCSYNAGGDEMTSSPLYQAGLVFGTAFVSAVTTQLMPWLSTQVKNGNARQFAIDCFNCLLRRSSPSLKTHPVSAMFPSLALDMVKELEIILDVLDKRSHPIVLTSTETVIYNLGSHGYLFRKPSKEELQSALPSEVMNAHLLGHKTFKGEERESLLASAVYKIIDQIEEGEGTPEAIAFKRHLADTYRVWWREGRVYPVLLDSHCISLILDGGRLEFGMIRPIAEDETMEDVQQSVLEALERRNQVTSSSGVQEEVSDSSLMKMLETLTISPKINRTRAIKEKSVDGLVSQ